MIETDTMLEGINRHIYTGENIKRIYEMNRFSSPCNDEQYIDEAIYNNAIMEQEQCDSDNCIHRK